MTEPQSVTGSQPMTYETAAARVEEIAADQKSGQHEEEIDARLPEVGDK